MTVKIPVSLTQEEETKLQAQAKAEGISVDVLLRRANLRNGSMAFLPWPHCQTRQSVGRAFIREKMSGGKCSVFSYERSPESSGPPASVVPGRAPRNHRPPKEELPSVSDDAARYPGITIIEPQNLSPREK